MSGKKLVTIFGATGKQGGSIVSLWSSNSSLQSQYSIRAITRDASKPAAQDLKSAGAEVVAADINDAASLKHALEGSYAVFAVTNYSELMSGEKEKAQGKAIADAAFAAGVKHLVWSSLPHTTNMTEGKLPQIDHFVSKAEVEEYIEQHKSRSGTVATYYMPGFFTSNFQGMGFINKGPDGIATWANFLPESSKYPLIDIKADTGNYIWGIIEAGSVLDGKQINGVSEWRTGKEIVDTFNSYGDAGQVKYVQIPRDTWKGFLAQQAGDYFAEEMAQNFDLIADYLYFGKGSDVKQPDHDKYLLNSKKTTFEEYVKQNAPFKF